MTTTPSSPSPIQLEPLERGTDPAQLLEMTFPGYRHLLPLEPQPRHPHLGEKDPVQPFAIVARRAERDGRIVALALADRPLEDGAGEAQLLSVFVRPEGRRAGLARLLVQAVETEVTERGLRELAAVYITGKPGIEWMERVLRHRGWNEPVPASFVARFRPEDGLALGYFRRLAKYAEDLEIFPWSELTREDLEEMRRSNAEARWIVPALEPWRHEPATLDASSVGARYHGRVVGWVLNHRVQPSMVRFTISYMRADLARRAKILALYHASLARLRDGGDCRFCTFITPYSYPRMIAFARRVIAPLSSFVGESRRITKDLGSRARGVSKAGAPS